MDGANPLRFRVYVFINAVPYSATADTLLQKTHGWLTTKIFMHSGRTLQTAEHVDPNNLPASLIRINWGNFVTKRLTAEPLADVYDQFGGTSKGVHPDQHNITLLKRMK